MSRLFATHETGNLRFLRDETPSIYSDWGPEKVDSDVWPMRNQLGLLESSDNYSKELKALIDVYANNGTIAATVTSWLAAVSNAVTAAELLAINQFISDVGATVAAKIVRFNPFVGTNATARTTPLIGSSTDTLVATPTWTTSAGYALNGTTQYINTGVTPAGVGTAIGGFGVHYNALTSANQTLIGSKDGSNGDFKLTYATSGTATTGTYGGTANSTTDATAIASLVKKYLHLSRTSSTNLEYYIDGVSTNVQATSTSVTSGNDAFFVGALNTDSVASGFTTGTVGCYCLTDGTLSDANVLTLAAAVNNLMGRLGRD